MFWSRRKKPREFPPKRTDELENPVGAVLSDVGCHRESNEDSGLVVSGGPDRGLLAVVADGMGGHQAGEVASRLAVETIRKEYAGNNGTPPQALAEAFRKAHWNILELARKNEALAGMGTTCTGLIIVGGEAWFAHVGDSRLYLVRDGGIYQLSEDHTQCMEMVRRGLMSREEAHQHEDRNLLTRAMGTRPELNASFPNAPMMVRPGDKYLLCSDGLHDLVTESEIQEVVTWNDAETACQKLVAMAKGRGGYDNVTVAVIAIPSAGAGDAPGKQTRTYEVNG